MMKLRTVLKLAGIAALGYSTFTAGRIYEVVHLSKKAFRLVKKILSTPISNEPKEETEETENTNDIQETPKMIKLELNEATYNAFKKAIEEAE